MYFSPPVSTAWTCQLTTPSRTWERNSSWLWRTRRASRGSTKKNSSPWLHPTNRQLKKNTQKKKSHRDVKPAAVAVLCEHVVLYSLPVSHLHSTVVWDCTAICRANMPTSLYLFSAVGPSSKGAGERTGESQRRMLKYYPQAWAGPLWSAVSFPSTLVLWKSTVLENTNAFQ